MEGLGSGKSDTSLDILFCYTFYTWNHVSVLYIQNKMKGGGSTMEYNRRQTYLFQMNSISSPKRWGVTQVTFEHSIWLYTLILNLKYTVHKC